MKCWYYDKAQRTDLENSMKYKNPSTRDLIPFLGNVQNRQIHGDKTQISSCQGLDMGSEKQLMCVQRFFWRR